MKASELEAQPQCPVLCTDGVDVVRCARWQGHEPPDLHMSYSDVLEQMYIALAATYGKDPDELAVTMSSITVVAQARAWYKRLVITDE